jgi:ribosome-binding factor A
MANPRRSQRVSQQIMREVSLLILSDKRARSTMSPEHRLGADSSISTVTSITDVVISGDLQARCCARARMARGRTQR